MKTASDAWTGWTPQDIKKHKVAVYQLPDGTFEAFAAKAPKPVGAVRLDPQPARPTSGDPHEGTRVAMKKLEAMHPLEIAWGCHLAVAIAKKNLTVHSRMMRQTMADRGMLALDTGREHWTGAVFKRLSKEGILRNTGQKFKYSDAERGIHEREVTIWALVEGADTSKYDNAPTEVLKP